MCFINFEKGEREGQRGKGPRTKEGLDTGKSPSLPPKKTCIKREREVGVLLPFLLPEASIVLEKPLTQALGVVSLIRVAGRKDTT